MCQFLRRQIMIEIAKNAGFCFGVKRAACSVMDVIQNSQPNMRIFTLGELIHNPIYLSQLKEKGVLSVSYDDIPLLVETTSEKSPAVLILRTHGISMDWKNKLLELSSSYPYFTIVDTTCPFVKRIQNIAHTQTNENTLFIVFGSQTHPEVQSILSYAQGERYALSSFDEVKEFAPDLLINAVTIKYTISAFKEVLPYLPDRCIISDIASVKTGLPEFYEEVKRPFVSTHPMFGPTFANLSDLSTQNTIIISESDHLGKVFFKDLYSRLHLNIFEYSFKEND